MPDLESKVLGRILEDINNYQQDGIMLASNFSWSQRQTIDEAIKLYNSQFLTIPKTSETLVFNIVRPRCKITSKQIDIDTKDIKLYSTNPSPASSFKTLLLELEIKHWMRQQSFGLILNEIVREIPKFGSVVVKKVKDTLNIPYMANFFIDQGAENLKTAGYCGELHYLTRQEIEEKKWKWKERILKDMRDQDFGRVIEWYGKMNKKDVMVVLGSVLKNKREYTYLMDTDFKGQILAIEDGMKKEDVYKDFHLNKQKGRWLGEGAIETLKDDQIAHNEGMNNLMRGLKWISRRYFQSRDKTLKGKNIFEDANDGEIFDVEREITLIDTQDRNLATFNTWFSAWGQHADQEAFSFDAVRGEPLPSGTPLGSAVLLAKQAGSYYEFTREDIAIKVKELFKDWIIPMFKKDRSAEHLFRLVGVDNIEIVDKAQGEYLMRENIFKFISRQGYIPSKVQADIMRQTLQEEMKRTGGRWGKIPSAFYENVDYDIDITIVGENIDLQSKMQTLQIALQIINTNPAMLQDKNSRKLFFKLMDLAGISPAEFEIEETLPQMQLPQGGSISVPSAPPLKTAPQFQTV